MILGTVNLARFLWMEAKSIRKFGWALNNPEEGKMVDDYIDLSYSIYDENG